jgi:hypothetical protein
VLKIRYTRRRTLVSNTVVTVGESERERMLEKTGAG